MKKDKHADCKKDDHITQSDTPFYVAERRGSFDERSEVEMNPLVLIFLLIHYSSIRISIEPT